MSENFEQNINRCNAVLKDIYLPAVKNQISVEPAPFLSKIRKVDLYGNEVVAAAPIGFSGGFGFSKEGGATPNAGNLMYQRFKSTSKDMYVNIEISEKTIRLAKDSGAMVNVLDREVKSAYESAKWNTGRALHGNGTGKLANVSAQSAAGAVIKVNSYANLKEGLIIDIYKANGENVTKGARIKAISRIADTNGLFDVTLFEKPSTAALAAGFITVQNSYNNEITGLGSIFDDSVTTLYGINKADAGWIKPITYDANNNIGDKVIRKALRLANEKNSNIDMLMMGADAFDWYVDYLASTNYRVEEKTKELVGGFKAVSLLYGNREVDVVYDEFVPTNEAWGIDTNALELHRSDWSFASLQGGGAFNLKEGTSVYRALLASYAELICTNPGGCVRIYNCAGSDTTSNTNTETKDNG